MKKYAAFLSLAMVCAGAGFVSQLNAADAAAGSEEQAAVDLDTVRSRLSQKNPQDDFNEGQRKQEALYLLNCAMKDSTEKWNHRHLTPMVHALNETGAFLVPEVLNKTRAYLQRQKFFLDKDLQGNVHFSLKALDRFEATLPEPVTQQQDSAGKESAVCPGNATCLFVTGVISAAAAYSASLYS